MRRRLALPLALAAALAGLAALRAPAGRALTARGVREREAGRSAAAVRWLTAARLMGGAKVETALELAATHQERGDFRAASALLARLPETADRGGAERARFAGLLALDRFHSGAAGRAVELQRRAVADAAEPGARAAAQVQLGWFLAAGPERYDEAEEALVSGLALARREGRASVEAEALVRLSDLAWRRGRDAERCRSAFLLPALAASRGAKDSRREALSRSRLGLVALAEGAYAEAQQDLLEAARLYEAAGDAAGRVDAEVYLGSLEVTLRRSRQALQHYRSGLELASRIGYHRGVHQARRMLADYFLRQGDHAQAIALCREVLGDEVPPSGADRRRVLATLGHATLHLGDPAGALASYREALAETPTGVDDAFQMQTTLMLGHAHLERGEGAPAAAAFDEAARLASRGGDWSQLVLVELAYADLAHRRGRPSEALTHLETAAEIEATTFGTSRTHLYRSQYWQVFRRTLALALDSESQPPTRDGATRLLFRFVEQMRHRALRGLLLREVAPRGELPSRASTDARLAAAAAELERLAAGGSGTASPAQLAAALGRYEREHLRSALEAEALGSLSTARPVELGEVEAGLRGDTVLVEYLFLEEEAFALVIARGRLACLALPLPRRALEAKARLLRSLLAGPHGGHWEPVAADLHAALIAPLREEGLLRGVRRLGIVPSGLLAELPFSALIDREAAAGRPRFLVEDLTLFFAPSVSVLAAASARPSSGGPLPALAFGATEHRPPLPRLPHAAEEARLVAALLGGEARVEGEATEAEWKRLAPRARLLHLATHAVVEPGVADLARVELGAAEGEDGRLTLREILSLELAADLVILSGCRTGLAHSRTGNELAADDRTGLVEAFLHAGARSVVASLWPVGDRSTAELMRALYAGEDGRGPAEALARAQRRSAAAGGPARTWASFILVGDPGG